MKVSVYRLEKGGMAVLIEASTGKGRAPVMLPDITPENLKERVRAEVDKARMPRVIRNRLKF